MPIYSGAMSQINSVRILITLRIAQTIIPQTKPKAVESKQSNR